MPTLSYHTFLIICLFIGGSYPQAWAESGGIQEETIELPMHKGKDKQQSLALPSATSGTIIEEDIPLSGNKNQFNQSISDVNIQAPKDSEGQLAKKQVDTQEKTGAEYLGMSASKLGGGVLDIATSWLEIPKTIVKVTREEGVATGLTIGVAKGIANTAEQAVSGAINVATFPVPQNLEIDMVENADGEFSMEETFGAAFKGDDAVKE